MGGENGTGIDIDSAEKGLALIWDLDRLAKTEGCYLIFSQRQSTTSSRWYVQRSHIQHLETIQPPSTLLRASAHPWLRCYELGYREVRPQVR